MNGPDDKPVPFPEVAASPEPTEPEVLQTWEARTWRALGAASVAIGVINAFIPLLPTTVFLLIGAWAYGKGDPRLRARLLAHPRFGPALERWVEHGQISTRGKIAACIGIGASMAITAWTLGSTPVTWVVDAGLALLILYLLTRPGAQPPTADRSSVI
ncbi:MAG: DUF454 domain-containing protein [Rubrivivax sp.]|nr:MAG: DUF454 domain-containing protein [Rubrivivax sp.]